MRPIALAAFVALVFLPDVRSLTQSGTTRRSLAVALDSYATGNHASALAAMRTPEAVRGASRWPRDLQQWVDADGADHRARRITVASIFALELTAIGAEGTLTEYSTTVPLLDAACDLVWTREVLEGERLFHLATIAVLQGATDETRVVSYARRAVARTPDARLFLAGVTAQPALRLIVDEPLQHGWLHRRRFPGTAADTKALRQLLTQLGQLVEEPSVGPEIRLRRGVLTFLMDEPGQGRDDLTAVARTADSYLAYLARIMLGVLYEHEGRLGDGIAEYRQALALVPAASAVTRLSVALFLDGGTVEAGALAARRPGNDFANDPWFLYSLRDYRFWPQYREQLRAQVRALTN